MTVTTGGAGGGAGRRAASSAPPGASILCMLLGSTTPLPAERIVARYSSTEAYLDEYREAADATIESGFVLEDDREVVLADADPDDRPEPAGEDAERSEAECGQPAHVLMEDHSQHDHSGV